MDDTLDTQPIGAFLDTLASNAPTPGGGSVAAVSGAMAAGLISMVCALTIGKKQFADIEDEVRRLHERAESLRHELQLLAQLDMEVFGRLSIAYKLPRTTEADAATRRAAIEKVTHQAAEVPLRIAQAAANLLPLCAALVSRCGRSIVSDIGVATLLARATVQSAVLSVEINLAGLEDQHFVRETRARIDDSITGLGEEEAAIIATVRARISG